MGLTETFQKAARTAFNAFGDIVLTGTYVQITDDGFNKTTVDHTISIIPVYDLEKEQDTIKFREIVQPNDIVFLVLGIELTVPIKIGSQIKCTPKEETAEQTFKIIDKNVDPAKALYILLARKL